MSDDKPCRACGGKGSFLDPDPDSRSYGLCGHCGGSGRATPGPGTPATAVPPPCIGRDPHCPCQDGDPCHYRDHGDTKAMPLPAESQDEGDVDAIIAAMRHARGGFAGADVEDEKIASAVLAVLRERGRLKEPEPVYPPFGQAMREMREEFGHLFTMPAQGAEPSGLPVTEAARKAIDLWLALDTRKDHTGYRFFNAPAVDRFGAAMTTLAAALAAREEGQ